MPADPRRCNRCGKTLTPGGRRSVSGIYYCKAKPCQAEKARQAWRAEHPEVEEQAPTHCAKCGKELEPRSVRMGDIPGLRWCHASACRRHKAATVAAGTGRTLGDFQVEIAARDAIIETLAVAYNVPRVTCSDCGITDAVDGYPHLDDFGTKCVGTGEKPLKIPAAQIIWPGKFGPHPAMLALAEQQIAEQSRPQEVHPE